MPGVQVITWGTGFYSPDEPSYNGMSHFFQTTFWGGNVGHAALLVTLPYTKENRLLVDKMLQGTGVPHQQKTYETKRIEFDKDTQKPLLTPQTAYKERVIEIYLSLWPSKDKQKGYTFSEYHRDVLDERLGVNVNIKPEWQEYLQPEKRRLSSGIPGLFATQQMLTLDSKRRIHLEGHTPLEETVLNGFERASYASDRSAVISLTKEKLTTRMKAHQEMATLSITEKMLIKNLLPSENVEDKVNIKELQKKLITLETRWSQTAIFSYLDYVNALINLNGGLQAAKQEIFLTSNDKDIYQRIERLRDLYQKLSMTENDPQAILKVNEILKDHPAFLTKASLFPNGIKNKEQLKQLQQSIEYDIDGDNNHGFAAQHKDAILRADLNQLYEVLGSIQRLKELKATLEHYLDSRGTAQETVAQKELLTLMEQYCNGARKDIAEKICSTFLPWREEDISFFQQRLESHFNLTTATENDFKKMAQLLNNPGNEILKVLTSKKADALFQKSILEGHPPSHTIELPLKTENQEGLDAQKIVTEIAALVSKGEKFNLINHNCSDFCSRILAAGAGERKDIFEQRALNYIANPQMVFNNALQYANSLSQPHLSSAQQQGYYDIVLNYLAQSTLHRAGNFIDPQRSYIAKMYDLGVGGTSATLGTTMAITKTSVHSLVELFSKYIGTSPPASSEKTVSEPSPSVKAPSTPSITQNKKLIFSKPNQNSVEKQTQEQEKETIKPKKPNFSNAKSKK